MVADWVSVAIFGIAHIATHTVEGLWLLTLCLWQYLVLHIATHTVSGGLSLFYCSTQHFLVPLLSP